MVAAGDDGAHVLVQPPEMVALDSWTAPKDGSTAHSDNRVGIAVVGLGCRGALDGADVHKVDRDGSTHKFGTAAAVYEEVVTYYNSNFCSNININHRIYYHS